MLHHNNGFALPLCLILLSSILSLSLFYWREALFMVDITHERIRYKQHLQDLKKALEKSTDLIAHNFTTLKTIVEKTKKPYVLPPYVMRRSEYLQAYTVIHRYPEHDNALIISITLNEHHTTCIGLSCVMQKRNKGDNEHLEYTLHYCTLGNLH